MDIDNLLVNNICTLSHTNCKNYCNFMINGIENNIITDFNKIFEKLIIFLNINPKCMNTPEVNNLINRIGDLVDFEKISGQVIGILRHLNSDYLQIFKNQIDKFNNISEKYFSNILLLQNRELNNYIINSKIDIINIVPNHIELLCSNPGLVTQEPASKKMVFIKQNASNYNVDYITKLSNKNPNAITKTAILFGILGNLNLELIDILISKNKNLVIDNDYLIASCYQQKEDLVEYFLNNRLEITNKCFLAIFANLLSYDILQVNGSYINYFNSNTTIFRTNKTNQLKIINIFQNYNYIFKYEDVLILTKNKIELPAFEKYNIVINDDFINLCNTLNFYPPYNQKLINMKAVGLFTPYTNLTQLKTQLNNLNYIPTQECLYKACENNLNISIIKYLISLGLKIDDKCIKLLALSLKNNKTFLTILDEYFENNKKLDYSLKDDSKIKELENKVKELQNKIKELENESIKKEQSNKNNNYLDKKIKLSKTKEIKVSNEFIELFDLKNNTIDFLTFKKVLLNYFKNNNLIQKDSFDIILDDKLIKVLKFDGYGNKINLKDLDEFCKFILSSFL